MADTDLYDVGVYAVYRGNVYRSFAETLAPTVTLRIEDGDPVPEGAQPDRRGPSGRYLVDPRHVTAWYSTRWTFRWKGEEFISGGVRNGRILGDYRVTKDAAFADQYLTRVGAFEYEGTFPFEEITGLTETRFDLLADWKEQHPET